MDFFTKIYAQSADTVAKSTIPFQVPGIASPTPFVTTTSAVTPTGSANDPSIYLDSVVNQLRVNGTTIVKIHINTQQRPIKSFKFMIKYDPTFFTITDASPSIANTQISFEDTFFVESVNQVDTTAGTISIDASSDQGTTTVSGRTVAQFEIKALKEGFSQISLQLANSSLLDTNNIDILKNTGTALDFTISNSAVVLTATPTQPIPTPTGKLPRNGIFDEIGTANAFISGTILIVVGMFLYKLQKHEKKKVY